jgi:hypothetical protein
MLPPSCVLPGRMLHPQMPIYPPGGATWAPIIDLNDITFPLVEKVLKGGPQSTTGLPGVCRDRKSLSFYVKVSLATAVLALCTVSGLCGSCEQREG